MNARNRLFWLTTVGGMGLCIVLALASDEITARYYYLVMFIVAATILIRCLWKAPTAPARMRILRIASAIGIIPAAGIIATDWVASLPYSLYIVFVGAIASCFILYPFMRRSHPEYAVDRLWFVVNMNGVLFGMLFLAVIGISWWGIAVLRPPEPIELRIPDYPPSAYQAYEKLIELVNSDEASRFAENLNNLPVEEHPRSYDAVSPLVSKYRSLHRRLLNAADRSEAIAIPDIDKTSERRLRWYSRGSTLRDFTRLAQREVGSLLATGDYSAAAEIIASHIRLARLWRNMPGEYLTYGHGLDNLGLTAEMTAEWLAATSDSPVVHRKLLREIVAVCASDSSAWETAIAANNDIECRELRERADTARYRSELRCPLLFDYAATCRSWAAVRIIIQDVGNEPYATAYPQLTAMDNPKSHFTPFWAMPTNAVGCWMYSPHFEGINRLLMWRETTRVRFSLLRLALQMRAKRTNINEDPSENEVNRQWHTDPMNYGDIALDTGEHEYIVQEPNLAQDAEPEDSMRVWAVSW